MSYYKQLVSLSYLRIAVFTIPVNQCLEKRCRTSSSHHTYTGIWVQLLNNHPFYRILFISAFQRTSFRVMSAITDKMAHITYTPIRIPRFGPTPSGVFNSSESRRASADVPDSKLQAKAWKECFTEEIHYSHTTHLAMKGKGTNPPDTARKMVTLLDPTKKARSWVGISIEIIVVINR